MMLEYLIRRTDEEWFLIHTNHYEKILRPQTFPAKTIEGWGDHRIETTGCEIGFSFEDPGVQLVVDRITITPDQVAQIVQEIARNIEDITGQQTKIIPL